jgi:hypothetical protein
LCVQVKKVSMAWFSGIMIFQPESARRVRLWPAGLSCQKSTGPTYISYRASFRPSSGYSKRTPSCIESGLPRAATPPRASGGNTKPTAKYLLRRQLHCTEPLCGFSGDFLNAFR